jgi:Flp pilus assembly protein TadG
MRKMRLSLVRRALYDQHGQTTAFVVLGIVALLGVAGLVIDVGHAYVVRSQLQNSANAAALAASGAVYNAQSDTVNATSEAEQYSASSGDQNASSKLGTVTTTVNTLCLNLLMPKGEACGSTSPSNAVRVANSTSVPTYFMKLFGVPTLTVGATATASIQGVANSWNVAIIVDGTQSMSNPDSNCGGLTEFQCALSSVQVFLGATNPGPNSNVRVSLFSFPNLSTSGFSDTSTCTSTFLNKQYTLPSTTATAYAPITYTGSSAFAATYQLAGWDSGYYSNATSGTGNLNTSDNLVKAIGVAYNTSTGAMGAKGCLPNKGGESTYYASVLYAAQAALIQEQKLNSGSQNAIILLSDGEANADSSKFPAKTSTASTGGLSVTAAGSSTYSKTATNLTGGAWGTYPDYNDECQQAIVAAQAATAAGTTVYAVAYGSEDTGCGAGGGTDTQLYATGNNVPFTLSSLTACVAMENMASNMSTFFSDPNQSGSDSSCTDSAHTTTTLADIALAIASNFTTPRLLPNNAQ